MMTARQRYILLAVMTVLTLCCLVLFPRININDDMTRYLPDDSRMKRGIDTIRTHLCEIDMNAYYVNAMFCGADDVDSLASQLTLIPGIGGIVSTETLGDKVLYRMSVADGADTKAVAQSVSERYGDAVVVEHNANSIMPDNMVLILIIGVLIVFGILFLMCSSIVEALLFILNIGMAVIMNMGTNALLPSVSMLTNTIVAVLQLVLSMDYSIILMNRFRQVLRQETDVQKAMELAVRSASPSILSSALTTIVGLLALVFMKFKIGMDLGIVLAKGVMFSLISIYTILPALVLIFYRGILKTGKKVFLLPTDRLSRFEMKFRIPLAVLFVVIFGVSWYMAGRTELSYASIWESQIDDVFPPKNNFSLLYRTSSEDKVIALTDSISSEKGVVMTMNYPSIFKRKMTPSQMCDNVTSLLAAFSAMPGTDIPDIAGRTDLLNPQTLGILYYAAKHTERDEKMSFDDMIALSEKASGSGLLPEGMDVSAIVGKFLAPEDPPVKQEAVPAVPPAPSAAAPSASPAPAAAEETEPAEAATPVEIPADTLGNLSEIAAPAVKESGDDPYGLRGKYSFTKEMLHTQMDCQGIADYLGFSRSQAAAAFAMAKKRNGTMTPDEFINYMIDKVLGNKLLRKMISAAQAEGLQYIRREMDAVLSAPVIEEELLSAPVDSVSRADTVSSAAPVRELPPVRTLAPEAAPAPDAKVTVVVETPMERLAGMYASGRKYSAGQIYGALNSAGIDVLDRGGVNLMFMYYGSTLACTDSLRMSLEEIIDFLCCEVAVSEDYALLLDGAARSSLGQLRAKVDEGTGMLRKEEWSMCAIVTDYPIESEETFDFVERTISRCDAVLGPDNCCLVGESVMYKEMKDGFRRELLILTLLTVLSIFLIVALTFKSVLIPSILVMTVLAGVNVNVFFSGVGGHTMLYLAYLIVQSILIGATIDYGILFTNYWLGFRRAGHSMEDALKQAYKGSIHTIMTSGLIIILAPLIMSELLNDPTICSILSSLTFGALAVIVLIVFVLPGVLAAIDKFIKH